MIYLDSRYVDGTLVKTWHARKEEYHTVVTREWPLYAQSYFIYEWVETDRLDNLANLYLGIHTMYMKYVIAHWTGKSFLGKSGWTSKAFARQFATFAEASDFCREHNLDEEGCYVELK